MSGSDGVQPLLRLGIYVRADNLADKDYVVSGLDLRIQRTFEICDGIGQKDGINLFGGGGLAMGLAMLRIEFGEFIDIAAGP